MRGWTRLDQKSCEMSRRPGMGTMKVEKRSWRIGDFDVTFFVPSSLEPAVPPFLESLLLLLLLLVGGSGWKGGPYEAIMPGVLNSSISAV